MTGIRAAFCVAIRYCEVVPDSNYVPLHHHDIPIASTMAESYFIIIDHLPGACEAKSSMKTLLQLTSIIGSDMASGEPDIASTQTNIQ